MLDHQYRLSQNIFKVFKATGYNPDKTFELIYRTHFKDKLNEDDAKKVIFSLLRKNYNILINDDGTIQEQDDEDKPFDKILSMIKGSDDMPSNSKQKKQVKREKDEDEEEFSDSDDLDDNPSLSLTKLGIPEEDLEKLFEYSILNVKDLAVSGLTLEELNEIGLDESAYLNYVNEALAYLDKLDEEKDSKMSKDIIKIDPDIEDLNWKIDSVKGRNKQKKKSKEASDSDLESKDKPEPKPKSKSKGKSKTNSEEKSSDKDEKEDKVISVQDDNIINVEINKYTNREIIDNSIGNEILKIISMNQNKNLRIDENLPITESKEDDDAIPIQSNQHDLGCTTTTTKNTLPPPPPPPDNQPIAEKTEDTYIPKRQSAMPPVFTSQSDQSEITKIMSKMSSISYPQIVKFLERKINES